MGLDDFFGDSSNSDDKSKNKPQKKEKKEEYPRHHRGDQGYLVPNGPYGFQTHEDYKDTIVGEMKTHIKNPKYLYQVFPHVLDEQLHEPGERYKLIVYQTQDMESVWVYDTITCISVSETQLYRIPREALMLDTARTDKQESLDVLSERFGYEVGPKDTVHIHHFCKPLGVTKAAGLSEVENQSTLDKIEIMVKGFIHSSEYQKLDEYDDFEGVTSIDKW